MGPTVTRDTDMVEPSKPQFRCFVFLGGLLDFSEPMGRIRMRDGLEKRKAKTTLRFCLTDG